MNKEVLHDEFQFKASRSSGPGGQNVNKVSTKITLLFNVPLSSALTEDEKQLLISKWENQLTKEGVFQLQCDETRSQLKNKELAIKRFFVKLESALKKAKPRKETKVSRSVKEKRIKEKKRLSDIKKTRKSPL